MSFQCCFKQASLEGSYTSESPTAKRWPRVSLCVISAPRIFILPTCGGQWDKSPAFSRGHYCVLLEVHPQPPL